MKDQPGEREDDADRTHTDVENQEPSGASTKEEPGTEPTDEKDDENQEPSGASTEQEPRTEPTDVKAAASEAPGDSEHPQKETAGAADPKDSDDEEEQRRSAEEFAREHDPANHDISAGEESRQKGDWTADEAGGPQVWDADGNLVEGSTPGDSGRGHEQSDDNGDAAADRRRTSALEEVRDGGYGVGSAAILEDGAIPLGHPIKAWEDTKTFVTPDDPNYGHADPDLWFTHADAAQNAGFRRAG